MCPTREAGGAAVSSVPLKHCSSRLLHTNLCAWRNLLVSIFLLYTSFSMLLL